MDQRNEIREFLASRRARITPGQAGLPACGSNRHIQGPGVGDLGCDTLGEVIQAAW